MTVKFCEVLIKVQDMERAIAFYEELFEIEHTRRYETRWASPIPQISLYNPAYDVAVGAECTEDDKHPTYGSNEILVLLTDDVERERERILEIGGQEVTEIHEINFVAPYRFFKFKDTEDNLIEVGIYPEG